MEINLSGRTFVFPNQCACCHGPPDRELIVAAQRSRGSRVVHTTKKTWEVPYCTSCLEHVQDSDNAYRSIKVVKVLAVVAAALGWLTVSFYTGLATGIAVVVVGGVVFYFQMTAAKHKMSAGCACVGRAVAYLGWQGTLHAFDVCSPSYAVAFMKANEAKLVNISDEAGRLLGGQGPPKGSARAPRTYVS